MILSVSRRTDIPAFYSDWFINRINEGFVMVRNPMNHNQISRIALNPDLIDCIVFWTKDSHNIFEKLDKFKDYNYYFQYTITPYEKDIEKNLRDKSEIIDEFKKLSEKIGPEKVIWRYDPIILTDKYTEEYHINAFSDFASALKGYAEKCVISFVDMYKSITVGMKAAGSLPIADLTMKRMGKEIAEIASLNSMKTATCCEAVDLSEFGIEHNKCIDDELISRILGKDLKIKKDKNQRENFGCVSSIDIGTYNTCSHTCIYCYANHGNSRVQKNNLKHNDNSPLLVGEISENDIILDRKMESYIDNNTVEQLSLFGEV